MAETAALDARGYRDAVTAAALVTADHAAYLDALCVPVEASGRAVGSDLAATLESAAAEAAAAADFASVSHALVDGARAAATGRAGRAMASVLDGIAEVLCNADRLDGRHFALALESAAERLAPADDGRHPGGLPSVVASSADGALAAHDSGAALAETIISAVDAGLEELERGPLADPRLADRGVVDAAAAGYLLVLDTLASVVTGEPLPSPPEPPTASASVAEASPTGLRYAVSCRLIPDEAGVEAAVHLEDVLLTMADVVEWEVAGPSWSVAVHTPEPGAVVEALVEVGRPRELRIGVLEASPGAGPEANRSEAAVAHAGGV